MPASGVDRSCRTAPAQLLHHRDVATGLSIVIPVLDEADAIAATLASVAAARARGAEVIVADGGSQDDTVAIARPLCDRVLLAPRGRALQLNAGAAASRGQVLCFLHADTRPPEGFDTSILERIGSQEQAWGRFDVSIAGRHPALRVVATAMNLRSRITGIATGDQVIFATRRLFQAAGGFPEQPLMEDIEFSTRAKRIARPICLRDRAHTSGRRWERHGVAATIVLMWQLRLVYYFGADPRKLHERYRNTR